MSERRIPSRHYHYLAKRYPKAMASLEDLGVALRDAGPIKGKTTELIQLAAAAAIQSEGAVHSHTRRALEAGASPEEINHALVLLVSTIGFPRAAAAISWARDILDK